MNKKIIKYMFYPVLFFYTMTALFTRSFVGIYIFGFRIGEIIVLVSLLTFIVWTYFLFRDKNRYNDNFLYLNLTLVVLFLVSLFLTNGSPFSSYTYKTSSYIWSLGYLFIGMLVANNLKVSKKIVLLGCFIPIIQYLMSTGRYPNFIIQFFIDYSDKFQFLKGADVMLNLLTIFSLIQIYNFNKNLEMSYIFLTTSLVAPMLLYQSRSAFIPLVVYILFYTILNIKLLSKNYFKTLILLTVSSTIFIFSSYNVFGNFEFQKVQKIFTLEEDVSVVITDLVEQKNTTEVFFSFYIDEGKLKSKDPTTNWRLDIWQDIIIDMRENNNFLTGYGYNSIIPAMTDPTAPGRFGRDGLNEHVHSYYFTILARGGIFQLIFMMFYYFNIFNNLKISSNRKILLMYLLPIAMHVSFDISMEGVQFPMVFLTFIGYLYTKLKLTEKTI